MHSACRWPICAPIRCDTPKQWTPVRSRSFTRHMSFSSRPIPHVISAHALSPACDHALSRSLPISSSACYSELLRIFSHTFTFNAIVFGACNIFLDVYFVFETTRAVPREDA